MADCTPIAAMRFDGRRTGNLDFRWSDYFPEFPGEKDPGAAAAYHAIKDDSGNNLAFIIDKMHSQPLAWQWREARKEWGIDSTSTAGAAEAHQVAAE